MSRYVVDANVALKWFFPEVYSDAAGRLLTGEHELLAPSLLFVEVGNALWRMGRGNVLSESKAQEILRGLSVMPLKIFSSAPLVEPALAIALRTGRTVYDSLYLALAVHRGCRMVSADLRLCNALGSSAFAPYLLWVADIP
ncbi:type II toxin-antitoxin system VapC family toxin [Gloeobacter morelensis]|uniref:Ribonuclease VapC n=1 Tax=Gloeobacter morelensis MG652769 TaxID=2781736 RepID=A0ABY3PGA5_9CYAN|nr:type II toxin-antitoxin system VapC family toxin [Gloeobacter morelensis]UFP92696.1 type II toxin-antitoxin system VapC family toxin [Gloeobacter morelensis MG652769]